MKIRNLTGINLTISDNGMEHFFEADEYCPKVSIEDVVVGDLNGITVIEQEVTIPDDFPEYEDDTVLIVSRMIYSALPDRDDLVCTGRVIKKDGRIVASKGFAI